MQKQLLMLGDFEKLCLVGTVAAFFSDQNPCPVQVGELVKPVLFYGVGVQKEVDMSPLFLLQVKEITRSEYLFSGPKWVAIMGKEVKDGA